MGTVDRCECCIALAAKVDGIEKDIEEFKEDTKSTIKEIKDDAKSDRKIMVDTLNALKENSIKISMFMEQTNEKMDDTKEQINKLTNKIDSMSTQPKDDGEKAWLRETISTHGKWLFWLLLLVVGTTLGAKFPDLINILTHIK